MKIYRKYHIISMIIICLLGVMVYSNSLHSPFVFDDISNITENSRIRMADLNLRKLIETAFSSGRPVAHFSFAINYHLGRYNVVGYRLINLAIHLINGCLVYFLVFVMLLQVLIPHKESLFNTRGFSDIQVLYSKISIASLFAALFFTVHPVQTQSVTYIVQRMNTLSAMFYFAAFILFIYGRISRKKWNRWMLWAGSLISWMLALGSKQIAAMLPFAVLLYDWYFLQHHNRQGLRRSLFQLCTVGVLLGVVGYLFLGSHPVDAILNGYDKWDFTLRERLLTQCRVVILYLSLVAYPHPSRLNLLHQINTSQSIVQPATTLFSMILILGLFGLAVWIARKHRLISFSILWFFIHLFIESSFIGLHMIFEHRLYLPIFGIALITGWLILQLPSRRYFLGISLSVVIVICLGTATYMRNFTWQDRITLWSDVVSKSPESPRAHSNLGLALAAGGQPEAAIRHYTRALVLNPIDSEIFNNLGMALAQQGNLEAAVDQYSTALRLDPNNAGAHYNLGISLERQGKTDAALNHLLQAIRIEPDFSEAHNNLGLILRRRGKLQEAVDHFSQAIKVQPDNVRAYNNMGVSLEQSGQSASAVTYYLEALRLKPDYLEAYVNLGAAFTSLGNLGEAVRSLNRALRLNPLDAGIHNNLGVVLHRKGNFKNAVKHFSRALKIKPGYGDAHTNMGITLFEQGHIAEAILHFRKALESSPGDPVLRRNLEKALQRLSR